MQRTEINVTDKGRAVWLHAAGVPALVAAFKAGGEACGKAGTARYDTMPANGFYGRSDIAKALTAGDSSMVAASDRLMSRFEAVDLETAAFRTRGAVCGGAVNIGAYLAGSPMAMRQRRRVMEDTNPVAVLIDLTVSGGVTAEQIARRGAAALALTRIVSQARPVTLHVMAGMKSGSRTTLVTCTVETSPLDLARAAVLLQEPATLRRVFFQVHAGEIAPQGINTASIRWAFADSSWQRDHMPGLLGGLLGADATVSVPGTVYGDGSDLLNSDEGAARWVQDHAARLLAMQDAA